MTAQVLWLACRAPIVLKDSGTLFRVGEGFKRDRNLLHTKTCPLGLITFFMLIKDQMDSDAFRLVGRHMICLHKGLLLSKEKEETITTHFNVTAPKFIVLNERDEMQNLHFKIALA